MGVSTRELPFLFKKMSIDRKCVWRRRNEKVLIINRIKDVSCADCGTKYPPCAMDFDHRDKDQKQFGVAREARTNRGIDRIIKEISKCDIVCANCHRIRTFKRKDHLN